MNRERSEKLFKASKQFIPGGVNSPVRAFGSVGGTPVFFKKAKGAVMTDVDGNDYVDYISSWGPMILGHADPDVLSAIEETGKNATSFGAPTGLELQLAQLICQHVPNMDTIRMVNSGTEACMSAIRVARGYTGRDKIIKFIGCYHGHADSFLIQAGSGAATMGVPSSPGVTAGTAKDTLTARYNNLEDVHELIGANPEQIAAIIIEPVAGNMGCVLPKPGFLEGLRRLCDDHGILLIFDEVMTGFRLSFGGAQQRLGIDADLCTYGKVIGGGLPVGAYGGKKEIMDVVAPLGPVYQAGTLSGNPLAMASGLATLNKIRANTAFYDELDAKTTQLHNGLKEVLKNKDFPTQINQMGSMISLFFCEHPVYDYETATQGNNDRFKRFFHYMLDRGFYLPPSSFEAWFLNNALSANQIESTLDAVSKFEG